MVKPPKLTKKGVKILGRLQDFYGIRKGKVIFYKMVEEEKLLKVEKKKK